MAEENKVTPPPPGEKPAETVTYTQAEVDAMMADKLKGQGKELKRLQAESAKNAEEAQKRADDAKAAAEAKAIEDGDALNVLKAEREDRAAKDAEKDARIAELEAKETKRAEALKASNDERVKALPEKYHDWPLPADLEQAAIAIGKLEDIEAGGKRSATRTRVAPPTGGNNASAEDYKAKLARLHNPDQRGRHRGGE